MTAAGSGWPKYILIVDPSRRLAPQHPRVHQERPSFVAIAVYTLVEWGGDS